MFTLLSQILFKSFQADEMGLFLHPHRWLVFSKSSKQFVLPRNLNLLPDSRFWSMEFYNNDSFYVKYLYKNSKSDQNYIETNFGIWTSHRGFIFFDEYIFPGRKRVNLNGSVIRTTHVVTQNETLNHLWDKRLKKIFL